MDWRFGPEMREIHDRYSQEESEMYYDLRKVFSRRIKFFG
jgi:hypothetical protein